MFFACGFDGCVHRFYDGSCVLSIVVPALFRFLDSKKICQTNVVQSTERVDWQAYRRTQGFALNRHQHRPIAVGAILYLKVDTLQYADGVLSFQASTRAILLRDLTLPCGRRGHLRGCCNANRTSVCLPRAPQHEAVYSIPFQRLSTTGGSKFFSSAQALPSSRRQVRFYLLFRFSRTSFF